MRVLFLVLAFMLLPSAARNLSCYIGSGHDTVIRDNFDYCSTLWNSETNSISYGGVKNLASRPVKEMYIFRVGYCNLNVMRKGPSIVECLCAESGCNSYVGLRSFQRIVNYQSQDVYESRVS
ncbi:unnamed protein product [Caenorhabditis brenneri]